MLARKVFDSPEVYLLEVPFTNVVTTETNVYVVRDGDDVLFVDMGAPDQAAAQYFLTAVRELGIDPNKARYFFTHLHYDHSGLVDMLLSNDVQLYIHADEVPAADLLYDVRLGCHACSRFQEEGMLLAQAEQLTSKIEIATPLVGSQRAICAVRGGDEIRVGRHVFEVVDLPGHTRGMAGLYDPSSGICFSGDQLLFIITPTTILSLDDADMVGLYRGSMQRLLDLHPTQVFHSHGEIRSDFEQRARAILESRSRRADLAQRLVVDACGQGRPPTGIEVISNMGWRIPFKTIEEAPLRQQWLIYAQGVTVLDYLVANGRIVRMVDESRTCAGGNTRITHRYRLAD